MTWDNCITFEIIYSEMNCQSIGSCHPWKLWCDRADPALGSAWRCLQKDRRKCSLFCSLVSGNCDRPKNKLAKN